MTAPDLQDPFHRILHVRLAEDLEKRKDALSKGSAARITEDTQSVPEKYAAQVAYIKALQDVLDLCEELEQERYIVVKRKDDED